MFHMNVSKNGSPGIQGSKIIEGLQLIFQTDIKVNTYIIEYSIISKQCQHERRKWSRNAFF